MTANDDIMYIDEATGVEAIEAPLVDLTIEGAERLARLLAETADVLADEVLAGRCRAAVDRLVRLVVFAGTFGRTEPDGRRLIAADVAEASEWCLLLDDIVAVSRTSDTGQRCRQWAQELRRLVDFAV